MCREQGKRGVGGREAGRGEGMGRGAGVGGETAGLSS